MIFRCLRLEKMERKRTKMKRGERKREGERQHNEKVLSTTKIFQGKKWACFTLSLSLARLYRPEGIIQKASNADMRTRIKLVVVWLKSGRRKTIVSTILHFSPFFGSQTPPIKMCSWLLFLRPRGRKPRNCSRKCSCSWQRGL